uniref:Uncharacterized protein n=1 Tax=Arundo donax TaxID=35708 RepID=A0A0A9CYC1_ARUDO
MARDLLVPPPPPSPPPDEPPRGFLPGGGCSLPALEEGFRSL